MMATLDNSLHHLQVPKQFLLQLELRRGKNSQTEDEGRSTEQIRSPTSSLPSPPQPNHHCCPYRQAEGSESPAVKSKARSVGHVGSCGDGSNSTHTSSGALVCFGNSNWNLRLHGWLKSHNRVMCGFCTNRCGCFI